MVWVCWYINISVYHIPTFLYFYILNLTTWLGYFMSYGSTSSIPLTSLSRSCYNSFVTNTTSISKSVTLTLFSLALSLKILSISKSLIRGVLCPNLIYLPLFLMPFIRSLVSKCYVHVITLILLFIEIMPTYSRYTVKELIYIIIIAPFS
jgi:hypothetical protein